MDSDRTSKTTENDAHGKYTQAYVDILSTYKEQINEAVIKKNELKEGFFTLISVIMLLLTILFIGSVILSFSLFIIMIKNDYESVSVIVGAVTGMITTLSTMILSIFKLPEIVAKYLFNKKEDDHMIEVIKNIQKYELESVKLEKTAKLDSEKEVAVVEKQDLPLNESIYLNSAQPTDVLDIAEQDTEITDIIEQCTETTDAIESC